MVTGVFPDLQAVLLDWKEDLLVPTVMPTSFIGIKIYVVFFKMS